MRCEPTLKRMSTLENLRQALGGLIDSNTQATYASAKALVRCELNEGVATVELRLAYPAATQHGTLAREIERVARGVEGVEGAHVQVTSAVVAHAVQRGVPLIAGVKNIIAVASGKGGVGKSTTAANLALALAAEGARVGLLDADIYGPSIPTMMGLAGAKPESLDGKLMEPLMAHGVQVMSMGFLVPADQAMIWRGPMATQAREQIWRQTAWKDLDYLVVDMPPGTGDVQLTLAQRVPVTGAVIVTTPQDIALLDARKGVAMFEKVSVPILGVVENMAVYHCPNCGHSEHIFGSGGGERYAAEKGLPLLGALPLALKIREQADGGTPTVVAEPAGAEAAIYGSIARQVAVRVAAMAKDFSAKFPTITISKDA